MQTRPTDFDSIAQHCIALVAETKHLPIAEIHLDSSLEALQVDSLDKVSLSFDIEEAYGIAIPDSALGAIKSMRDVVTGVQAALRRKSEAAVPAPGQDLISAAAAPEPANILQAGTVSMLSSTASAHPSTVEPAKISSQPIEPAK